MIRRTAAGLFLHDLKNRGLSAWTLSLLLIAFYGILYFGQDYWTPDSPCTDNASCYSEGAVCRRAPASARAASSVAKTGSTAPRRSTSTSSAGRSAPPWTRPPDQTAP